MIEELVSKIEEIYRSGEDYIKEARDIAQKMKEYPNKLDNIFYLDCQDKLDIIYDELLERSLRVSTLLKDAEAFAILSVRDKYQDEKKKPNADQLKSEARELYSSIASYDAVLDSWQKSVRNYVSGARAHINALAGRENKSE